MICTVTWRHGNFVNPWFRIKLFDRKRRSWDSDLVGYLEIQFGATAKLGQIVSRGVLKLRRFSIFIDFLEFSGDPPLQNCLKAVFTTVLTLFR